MANLPPFFFISIGALINLVTVYCLKVSEGMTRPLPSLGVAVSIITTQWCLGIATARGSDIAFAITAGIVLVIIFAAIIGPCLGEPTPSALKIMGYVVAIIGVAIAGIAK